MTVSNPNQQIWWLAKAFYRQKQKRNWLPPGFGPGHKFWRHFQRLRWRLVKEGWLKLWKVYLVAQFFYSPDPEGLYPQMLYGDKAAQKFQYYLERKKRRVGRVHVKELQSEFSLDPNRVKSLFIQSAWALESFLRGGFTEEEAFKGFPHEFHPYFVVINPTIWDKFCHHDSSGFSEEIKKAFEFLYSSLDGGRDRRIEAMREEYERARREQASVWKRFDRRAAVEEVPLDLGG